MFIRYTVGAAGLVGISPRASARSGTYATLIDLTRCDGCSNESLPRCVEACRGVNQSRFPAPREPIKDLWPASVWSR